MVWHAGEIELQRLVGSDEQLARVGPRVIRPFMPEQHRELFESCCKKILGRWYLCSPNRCATRNL